MLSFQLKMPNVGSWNGQLSGQDKGYFLVRKLNKSQKNIPLKEGKATFYYNFGDGWGASVTVETVDAAEAKRRRKNSAGFANYDWMVDEIIQYGRIRTRDERIEAEKEKSNSF